MLKIEKYAKDKFGIVLNKNQLELIAIIAANPQEKDAFKFAGRNTGKTVAVKIAMAYLQDGLSEVKK